MLTALAILFVLSSAFLIGRRVARDVPDEIEPARAYLRMAPDVLVLIMAGLLLAQQRSVALAIVALAALVALRVLVSPGRACALAGGLAVGLAIYLESPVLVPLCVLCLALNYLIGALAKDLPESARAGLLQPGAAAVLLLATRLVLG